MERKCVDCANCVPSKSSHGMAWCQMKKTAFGLKHKPCDDFVQKKLETVANALYCLDNESAETVAELIDNPQEQTEEMKKLFIDRYDK